MQSSAKSFENRRLRYSASRNKFGCAVCQIGWSYHRLSMPRQTTEIPLLAPASQQLLMRAIDLWVSCIL